MDTPCTYRRIAFGRTFCEFLMCDEAIYHVTKEMDGECRRNFVTKAGDEKATEDL